jgi:hypothetical protein
MGDVLREVPLTKTQAGDVDADVRARYPAACGTNIADMLYSPHGMANHLLQCKH